MWNCPEICYRMLAACINGMIHFLGIWKLNMATSATNVANTTELNINLLSLSKSTMNLSSSTTLSAASFGVIPQNDFALYFTCLGCVVSTTLLSWSIKQAALLGMCHCTFPIF